MSSSSPANRQDIEKRLLSPREFEDLSKRANDRLAYIQQNPDIAREAEVSAKVERLYSVLAKQTENYKKLSDAKLAPDTALVEELKAGAIELWDLNEELHSIRLATFAGVQEKAHGPLVAALEQGFPENDPIGKKMLKFAKGLTVNAQELLESGSDARKQNVFYVVTKQGFTIDGIALFDAQKEVDEACAAVRNTPRKYALLSDLKAALVQLEANADPVAKSTLFYHRNVAPKSDPEGKRLLKAIGMGFGFTVAGYSFLKSLVIDPLVFKKKAEIPKDWPTWMWLGLAMYWKNPEMLQSKFQDSLKTFQKFNDPRANRLFGSAKMNKDISEAFFELRKENSSDSAGFRGLLKKETPITDTELASALPVESKLYVALRQQSPEDRRTLLATLNAVQKNQEDAANTYIDEWVKKRIATTVADAQATAQKKLENGEELPTR